ncbi:hypothetical protein [Robbsia andropogonis]|uniref:hypothetical protein n=1 Tax=Robbsia andropogonis TaxID=28092 RepID=UPI002A6A528C|nr:hypothetical protein [Robbsia andropogonis]
MPGAGQDLKGLAKVAGVPEFKSMPYILDIDLDYFHSERSIEPVESNTFYQLICNALAVPIATEPWYVDRLKTAGSTITAEWLLERMTRHIEAAMT